MQSQKPEVSVEFSLDIPQDAVSCEELDLIQAHFAGLIRQLMMEADSLETQLGARLWTW